MLPEPATPRLLAFSVLCLSDLPHDMLCVGCGKELCRSSLHLTMSTCCVVFGGFPVLPSQARSKPNTCQRVVGCVVHLYQAGDWTSCTRSVYTPRRKTRFGKPNLSSTRHPSAFAQAEHGPDSQVVGAALGRKRDKGLKKHKTD